MSQHTGRIHLYTCIPERDSRPQPLYENLRPEELESCTSSGKGLITTLLLKRDTKFHHVLQKFLSEWGNLRPIERNKLLGKPLQLPLSIELCYLKESINHSSQVSAFLTSIESFALVFVWFLYMVFIAITDLEAVGEWVRWVSFLFVGLEFRPF